ncbi:MAG: hypothetical protein AB7L41_05910 [Flavobacteriaceae bacterium]
MRLGTLVALLALLAAGPAPAQESTAEARRLEAYSILRSNPEPVIMTTMFSHAGRYHSLPDKVYSDHLEVAYDGVNSAYNLPRYFPVLAPVYEALAETGTGRERIAARIGLARLVWMAGDPDGALRRLDAIIADAEAAGMADEEFMSALADAAALHRKAGDEAAAERLSARAASCGVANCPRDVVFDLMERMQKLKPPELPAAPDWTVLLGRAEGLLDELAPSRAGLRADMYLNRARIIQIHRPMDAADLARIGFAFFESRPDADLAALVKTASDVMFFQLYASEYRRVDDIARRVEARLGGAVPALADWAEFRRIWARAQTYLDAPDLHASYDAVVGALENSPGPHAKVGLRLLRDIADTPFDDLFDRLAALLLAGDRGDSLLALAARRRASAGDPAAAAELIAEIRARERGNKPLKKFQRVAYQLQEGLYRRAAGQEQAAAALLQTATFEGYAIPAEGAPLPAFDFAMTSTYDMIRPIINLREDGLYDAAAWLMSTDMLRFTDAIEANGTYTDSQTLWQMAYTFARVGEQALAFDLMNRAARIASNLSFRNAEGPTGGSLQLLERDRSRYLLFIDIAWAALTGERPQEMLVLSRY